MTGRPHLDHLGQDGIAVAVDGQGFHILAVPGCVPLAPQLPAAAAVISHPAGPQSFFKGFLCHVGQHEDLPCFVILGHHGDHPVTVQFKCIKIHGGDQIHFRSFLSGQDLYCFFAHPLILLFKTYPDGIGVGCQPFCFRKCLNVPVYGFKGLFGIIDNAGFFHEIIHG